MARRKLLGGLHVLAERCVLGQRAGLCTFCEKRFDAFPSCRCVEGYMIASDERVRDDVSTTNNSIATNLSTEMETDE